MVSEAALHDGGSPRDSQYDRRHWWDGSNARHWWPQVHARRGAAGAGRMCKREGGRSTRRRHMVLSFGGSPKVPHVTLAVGRVAG